MFNMVFEWVMGANPEAVGQLVDRWGDKQGPFAHPTPGSQDRVVRLGVKDGGSFCPVAEVIQNSSGGTSIRVVAEDPRLLNIHIATIRENLR